MLRLLATKVRSQCFPTSSSPVELLLIETFAPLTGVRQRFVAIYISVFGLGELTRRNIVLV